MVRKTYQAGRPFTNISDDRRYIAKAFLAFADTTNRKRILRYRINGRCVIARFVRGDFVRLHKTVLDSDDDMLGVILGLRVGDVEDDVPEQYLVQVLGSDARRWIEDTELQFAPVRIPGYQPADLRL